MSKQLYPHVFGSGHTVCNPLRLRDYARRMTLPFGFTTQGQSEQPETTAYAAEFATYSQTLSAEGRAAVDELFVANNTVGATLLRGWIFGSKVNLAAASGRVLDLTGNADFVLQDVADCTWTVNEGSSRLLADTSGKGYLTAGEQVLSNTDWSMLLFVNKPTRGSSTASEDSYFLSQYTSSADGHFAMAGLRDANSQVYMFGAAPSATLNMYSDGIDNIRPLIVWLTYNATTRELKAYDAFTDSQLGVTTTLAAGGFAAINTRLGTMGVGTEGRLLQYAGLFKFSGVLSTQDRSDLFDTYYDVCTRFNNQVLIYGNSVTAGSDATVASSGWRNKFKVWGSANNCFVWSPANMGAKSLIYWRPTDYALTPAREAILSGMVARDTTASVDLFFDKKIHIVVFDENQNQADKVGYTGGSSSDLIYEDFAEVADAIADSLRVYDSTLQVVCGTMLALQATEVGAETAMTWADVNASPWRNHLRDWSAEIRTDVRFDAVYDLYTDFNLGWAVGDDGDAENPTTDLPKGNTAYYAGTEPQHPNDAGHAVIATGFETAVASVQRG